ncbi:hypothetical protein PtA15_3A236 [Puccinia triticina]|nr:uncharacterized protein PtA15_3A236 [Puccinia triticina]WAQ82871.1 hypothetical protein PtA15_3A236 [Puccinia triticina]WAR53697.1 hypothetical protein PtB15_3B206 [Puccinia triticina]
MQHCQLAMAIAASQPHKGSIGSLAMVSRRSDPPELNPWWLASREAAAPSRRGGLALAHAISKKVSFGLTPMEAYECLPLSKMQKPSIIMKHFSLIAAFLAAALVPISSAMHVTTDDGFTAAASFIGESGGGGSDAVKTYGYDTKNGARLRA